MLGNDMNVWMASKISQICACDRGIFPFVLFDPTSNPGPFDIEAAREKALVKSDHVTPQILDIFVTWPYYGYASTGGELIEVTKYFLKYLSKYIARDTNQDRKINVFMSFFLFPLGSCSLNRLK